MARVPERTNRRRGPRSKGCGRTTGHAERFDGIGYVFAEDDEFCGVDLDACRCADDGRLTSWATAIVSSVNSYCEVSPSKEGVKLIVRGKPPIPDKNGTHRKLHDVETFGDKSPEVAVYDKRRFWCLTGHRVEGTPATIEPRQEPSTHCSSTTLHER